MFKVTLKNIVFICLFFFMMPIYMANECSKIDHQALPMYHLLKKQSRSMESIIIQRNMSTLRECREFAVSRKALAFNYYSISNLIAHSSTRFNNNRNKNNKRNESSDNDNYNYNCQVLNCPEINSFSSLVNDTRFNYYSLYPRRLLPTKSSANYVVTCVPKAGLFIFSKIQKNFSEAQQTCENMHGVLAHIVSAERTQGLAKFINEPTFVGLSSKGKKRIWKNEFGEPLSCFEYRAWGKGEPTRSRGCASLVKIKTNPPGLQSFWKVASCSRPLPFICEILPLQSKMKNHQST